MPAPTQAPTVPLHRIRFFDHTPSPITALSFAPIPLPPARDPSAPNTSTKGKAREDGSPELGVLVVARENGEVEIWQYVPADEGGMGNWVLSKASYIFCDLELTSDAAAYAHPPDDLEHGSRDP